MNSGVVTLGQALVSEHPADLEHLLEPARRPAASGRARGRCAGRDRCRECCGASRRAWRSRRRGWRAAPASRPRRTPCPRASAQRADAGGCERQERRGSARWPTGPPRAGESASRSRRCPSTCRRSRAPRPAAPTCGPAPTSSPLRVRMILPVPRPSPERQLGEALEVLGDLFQREQLDLSDESRKVAKASAPGAGRA